jgi:hypothetical protein
MVECMHMGHMGHIHMGHILDMGHIECMGHLGQWQWRAMHVHERRVSSGEAVVRMCGVEGDGRGGSGSRGGSGPYYTYYGTYCTYCLPGSHTYAQQQYE